MINLHEKELFGNSNPPHTPTIITDLLASVSPINLILLLTAFSGIIGRSKHIPFRLSNRRNSTIHLFCNSKDTVSSQFSVALIVSRIKVLVPANTGASNPLSLKIEAALEAHNFSGKWWTKFFEGVKINFLVH